MGIVLNGDAHAVTEVINGKDRTCALFFYLYASEPSGENAIDATVALWEQASVQQSM